MLWKGQENWSQSQSEFCCYLTVWPWAGPSVLWSVCPLCLSGMGATLQWPLNISSCSIVQGDAQDPNENASTSTVDYRKWRWYSSYIKVRMCIPAECCLIARGQERPRASRLLLSSFPKAIAKCIAQTRNHQLHHWYLGNSESKLESLLELFVLNISLVL